METETNLSAEEIRSNLQCVEQRIAAASARAGRRPDDVTLVAVSKTKPAEDVAFALAAGQRHFGENYVQELNEKIRIFEERPEAEGVHWHMIGHLQRNKVKYLVGRVSLIHSVDTVALAEQIEKESAKKGVVTEILLEINVAGEESKWGFSMEEAKDAAGAVKALPHVRLIGLMTSAPYTEDPESNRGYFRALKALSDRLYAEGLSVPSGNGFRTPALSMGMTGDFEVAVEEGATMVRVGTAVFGARNYADQKVIQ
jgi:pyridoxal phosphate enzyme (YggS family)